MNQILPIREIMTRNVLFVKPEDSMEKASEIFRMNNIHHIPVLDAEGKVAGILSKGDYLNILHGFTMFKTEKSGDYNQAILRSLLVGEVMTKQVATLFPDDTLKTAADYFRENLFHAIPVVDTHRKLVGIITTYDLLSYAFTEPVYLE